MDRKLMITTTLLVSFCSISSIYASGKQQPELRDGRPQPQLYDAKKYNEKEAQTRAGIAAVNAFGNHLHDNAEGAVFAGLNIAGAYQAGEKARQEALKKK